MAQNFNVTVPFPGTAVPLSAVTKLVPAFKVVGLLSNSQDKYVFAGGPTVSQTSGLPLGPGDVDAHPPRDGFWYDLKNEWIDAQVANEGVTVIIYNT